MCAVWTRRSGIQLAYPMDLKKLAKYPLPWIVQPKLNGERCRAIIMRGSVTLLSSEMNEITTLPHINTYLASKNLPDLELDGEIYLHGMSKQEIGSYLRRNQPKEGFEKIEYHIFDLVCNRPQIQRIEALWSDLWPMLKGVGPIRLVEVYNVEDARRLLDLLDHFVGLKYEGLIVRNPLGEYERKRTPNMLKWKPKYKDSYKIVDVEEEVDQHGVPKRMLGAIWCEKDGERFKVSAGGFSHDQRKLYWRSGGWWIVGKYLLVRYPELTDRGVPMHAVALEITDKEVEDDE